MHVRHRLVELRLPSGDVNRRLAGEDQLLHSSLNVDDARNVLLRVDYVAGWLAKANEADEDSTSWQAIDRAGIQLVDGRTVRKCLGVRLVGAAARASRDDDRHRDQQPP